MALDVFEVLSTNFRDSFSGLVRYDLEFIRVLTRAYWLSELEQELLLVKVLFFVDVRNRATIERDSADRKAEEEAKRQKKQEPEKDLARS